MIYEVLIGDKGITCTCSFETLSQSMKEWLSKHAVCAKCRKRLQDSEGCCEGGNNSSIWIDILLHDEFEALWRMDKKRERAQQSKHLRNVRENKAEGFFKKEDINAIYHVQNGQCFYCKNNLLDKNQKNAFEIEHIIPLSDEGTNWPSNLCLSCKKCNQKKGNRFSNDFWKIIRQDRGAEFVLCSKKENKKHSSIKESLTNIRREELLNLYIFEDSPFLKIKKILENENVRSDRIQNAEFRTAFYDILHVQIKKLSLEIFDKAEYKLNKKQRFSLLLARPLLIESIYNFLDATYSDLKDFKKRFELSELFFDERCFLSPFMNDSLLYDLSLEETEKEIPEFLELKREFLYYLDNQGKNGFDKVKAAFLKIHQIYLDKPLI